MRMQFPTAASRKTAGNVFKINALIPWPILRTGLCRIKRPLAALLLVLVSGVATRADPNLFFTGILVEPPPCKINDGKDIEVDFQNIGSNKIDGTNYSRRIDYRLSCEANTHGWQMQMKLSSGNIADFDKTAIQTDVKNFAIKIYLNGTPYEINSAVNIDPDAPPVLDAVPVKKAGSTLTESPFNASATLSVEYQ